MPKMHIDKSIEINAPVEKVFKAINNFHDWEAWSPWLIQDPKASVSVREDGKYFEWTGSRTGQGNMTVLHESENQSVDYDLTFLKPWKSKAKVFFDVRVIMAELKYPGVWTAVYPSFYFG